MFPNIVIDELPLNELHRVKGAVVCGHSAVDELRYMGVDKRRKYALLVSKAADDEVGVHSAFDDLERDPLRKISGLKRSLINGPHSAPTKLADDLVFSYLGRHVVLRAVKDLKCIAFKIVAFVIGGGEHAGDLTPHLGVTAAMLGNKGGPLAGRPF